MLKQRLVGATMIIALAVVLIPMILDGAGLHVIPDIPDTPRYIANTAAKTIRVIHHKIPQPASALKSSKSSKSKAKISSQKLTKSNVEIKSAAVVKKSVQKKISKNSKDKTWVVQIASFKSNENAKILKKKLEKEGFRTFIQKTKSKGDRKTVYRVRVGPEEDRAKLKEILSKLKQKVRLNGYIIVQY